MTCASSLSAQQLWLKPDEPPARRGAPPALLAQSNDHADHGRYAEALRLLFRALVAALNGHAVAGGCMLATAADYRVMADGKARISLNEITFGASLFAGSVEMLRHLVGPRQAEAIALEGAMFPAERAREIGLVDEVAPAETVLTRAVEIATDMASRDATAYAAVKRLLRGPVLERIRLSEAAGLQSFVEIWYSPTTREQLKKIRIRA